MTIATNLSRVGDDILFKVPNDDMAESRPVLKNIRKVREYIQVEPTDKVNDIIVPDTDKLIPVENVRDGFSEELKITIVDKGGEWYGNIKIRGTNNSTFRIKKATLTSLDNFKLNGIISTYLEYVSYYNNLTDAVSRVPHVEQIQTVHNKDVLLAIDMLRDDLLVLKEKIKGQAEYISTIIKNSIANKDIIVEEVTFKRYFELLLEHLRFKNKPVIDTKNILEKI